VSTDVVCRLRIIGTFCQPFLYRVTVRRRVVVDATLETVTNIHQRFLHTAACAGTRYDTTATSLTRTVSSANATQNKSVKKKVKSDTW